MIVGYYLTLNRAQGQTLDQCGLDLPESVFTHGHLYVGFTRCGDPDKIFVHIDQDEFKHIDGLPSDKIFTRNIVYPEIFQKCN